MGICPVCGDFIDPGEVFCPHCGYGGTGGSTGRDETVEIDGEEYDKDRVEEVLRSYGYDLRDLEFDLIEDDDLEDILDELESYF